MMLPGMIPSLGMAGAAVSLAFLTSAVDTTSASTYNFSVALPAYGKPVLMVVGAVSHTAATQTHNSVSWNGIGASSLQTVIHGSLSSWLRTSLWSIAVPGGSQGATANVTLTLSGTATRAGIGVWVVQDPTSTTPIATPSASAANPLTLNYGSLPPGAVAIGFAGGVVGSSTYSWTTLSEDFDGVVAASTVYFTGAHGTGPGGSYSATATNSGSPSRSAAVGAAFI